ncbi:MAG: EF-hand domain-containing protein [Deltaproteobacteria bacterium]|nr:EF-hand domain-containing protein [Deltaproteobacteria bacterium]
MKRFLTAILLVFFCTAISLADDSDLKKIDKNNDGKISKKEYIDAVIKTFNKLDKNTDGFLTKEELKTIDKIDAEKFVKEEDINKDGKVSKEEFIKAAEKRFKLLDKNNNGFIDQKEWNETKDSVNQNNPKISPVAPFIVFSF